MEYVLNAASTGIEALSNVVVEVRSTGAMIHIRGLAPSRLP